MGSKHRNVTCKMLDTGAVLPSESCNLAFKPKDTEKCNPGPCTVTWLASDWSEVGVTIFAKPFYFLVFLKGKIKLPVMNSKLVVTGYLVVNVQKRFFQG